MDEFSNFTTMKQELMNEKEGRKILSETRLSFGVPFLDMALKGIFKNDLVLLGADSGAGKTELAAHITLANLNQNKKIAFFALEAEQQEIGRRMLYKRLAQRFFRQKQKGTFQAINYYDWYNAEIDHLFEDFYDEEVRNLANETEGLLLRYRKDSDFTIKTLMTEVRSLKNYDMIAIDHYHHFDFAGEDENAEMKQSIKDIRDMGLLYGIPVLLLGQLRKRDSNAKKFSPVPSMDDFLGASELYKNPTKIILLGAGGPYKDPDQGKTQTGSNNSLSTTYVNIAKLRQDGSRTKFLGKTIFDSSTNAYREEFTLGKFVSGDWHNFDKNDYPHWARPKPSASQRHDVVNHAAHLNKEAGD
jgi:archaellum biogenesis ATPase FlaH